MIKYLKNKESIQLILISISIFSMNASWILRKRRNSILDIDEAGYLTMAWNNWNSFGLEGLLGFIQSVINQPLHAPLQPAITALFFAPIGPKIIFGLLIPNFFYVGVFIIVFKMLRTSYQNFESFYLAFFITQLNFVVAYSRNYNFAMSTTFFVLISTYLIIYIKSGSKLYNVFLGLTLGGILLTRNVSVIYLPFLLIIFLIIQVMGKRKKIDILKSFIVVISTIIAICLPWFSKNANLVFNYLTNFGYGDRSKEYGNENFLFTIENIKEHIFRLTLYQYSITTLIVLIVIPLILMFIHLLKGRISKIRRFNFSNDNIAIICLFILIFGSLLILMTSRNKGSGFDLPIIILVHILFLLVVKINPHKLIRMLVSLIIFIQIAIFIESKNLYRVPIEKIQIPFIEFSIPMIPDNNITLGYLRGGLNEKELTAKETKEFEWLNSGVDPEFKWNEVKVSIIRFLEQSNSDSQFVMMTTRHRIVNPNSINLIRAQEKKSLIPFWFLPAQEISDSDVMKIKEVLDSEFDIKPCTVIQSDGILNEILPKTPDQEIVEQLGKRDYILRYTISMPDYRILKFYQSKEYCINQTSTDWEKAR
jgi:hypothetical protein